MSLADALRGAEAPAARPVVASLTDRTRGNAAMVRLGRHKLVAHHGYEECQLFDLEADPEESHDLGTDPSRQDVVNDLARHLEGNWEPALAREHAIRSEARLRLLREGSGATKPPLPDHWTCDTSKLWFGRS